MAHDPFDLQAQADAEAEARRRADVQSKEELADMRWLVDGKRGRRILHRLLSQLRAMPVESCFDTNAMSMAFKEGMQFQGVTLMQKIIDHFPEQYLQMLKENKE